MTRSDFAQFVSNALENELNRVSHDAMVENPSDQGDCSEILCCVDGKEYTVIIKEL